jgi:hypothetical protein
MMNLTARNTDRNEKFKKWALLDDDSGKLYGSLFYNSYRGESFTVEINNPLHKDLAPLCVKMFSVREEALTWAREQIENLQEPTVADYEAAIRKVKDFRYRDEMADDFAYSNGKIARWDRLERELKDRMHSLTPSAT